MDSPPNLRPLATRHPSGMPGGFESEGEGETSPTRTVYDDAVSHYGHSRNTSSIPHDFPSTIARPALPKSDGAHSVAGEGYSSTLDEREIGRKLMDVESSFLPSQVDFSAHGALPHSQSSTQDLAAQDDSLRTPASTKYRTSDQDDTTTQLAPPSELKSVNTSSLETMSSSPTAAAAKRAVSRVVSMATMGGYETADEGGNRQDGEGADNGAEDGTPTKTHAPEASAEASPTPTKPKAPAIDTAGGDDDADDEFRERKTPRRRPRWLSSRHASARSSRSSNTIDSADGGPDAEYALQSGGGMPLNETALAPRPSTKSLTRTISLGSVASGVSRLAETERGGSSVVTRRGLGDLEEVGADSGMQTPRGPRPRLDTPTDTVINQRVRNLEVPGTVARKFRQAEGSGTGGDSGSDRGTNGGSTATAAKVKNLTLKEQSSVIDRLQKENWQLKLKLYFMDQMQAQRSDEGVRAMISENVELKTHKLSAAKEIRGLKRSQRELEAKIKERDERLAAQQAAMRNQLLSPGQTRERSDATGEMSYLRERVETYEIEIERLRTDSTVKEGEKRRLAEMLKTTGERSSATSDMQVREEVALWKDLLETESARKDQAEEDNRRLQEEIWRLKAEGQRSPMGSHQTNGYSKLSRTISDDDDSKSTNILVEQLRHENAELKRDLGAQTSMLTSRNREKERLYQEIEDLKMGSRRRSTADGSRSGGGTDSLLERSASRARQRGGRPGSRSSGHSGGHGTKMDDAERDAYESANDTLRDQLAALKLENQELATQLDRILDELEQAACAREELEQTQRRYDELAEQSDADIMAMQTERDEALQLQEEAELGFQDLRQEAQDKIDALETELDQNAEAIQRLEEELRQRDGEVAALRNEVRMTSEGLDKVEADVQAKVRRIQELELETEELGREMEGLETGMIAANAKGEKLAVELESRQGECAFLREEQDACMIKIGDLETALRAAQASGAAERDKARDLDKRLAEERHQREVIGSKEKQEVQRMMNDLNREATTARDEERRLKKTLETRDAELKKWKERLAELEAGLHEVLGETSGSKSSFVHAIIRLQKDLEHTAAELENSRQALAEKSRIFSKREGLLESTGIEARKLADLLEKERSGRRAERAQYEQWEKIHSHNSRTLSQKDARIGELETGRQSDKKKLSALEAQFKEQLQERNSLLLKLWSQLSALCGSDWQHQNSLVGGQHYPTLEVVASRLPQFQQHLLLAVKAIETTVGGFRKRVRDVEHDLAKDYQQLEHALDLRIKRLDRLEAAVQVSRVAGAVGAAPEIARLRGENKLLQSELAALRKQEQVRAARANAVSIETGPLPLPPASSKGTATPTGLGNRARLSAALARSHTTGAVESWQRQVGNEMALTPRSPASDAGSGSVAAPPAPAGTILAAPPPSSSTAAGARSSPSGSAPVPEQQRWYHRLRDLEKRLKAEREARLVDRSGARQRLEQEQQVAEELRAALEREKQRNSMSGD